MVTRFRSCKNNIMKKKFCVDKIEYQGYIRLYIYVKAYVSFEK